MNIENFCNKIKENNLNVKCFAIYDNGKIFTHEFEKNCFNKLNDIRSLTKNVTVLGVLKLIEMKKLTLDSKVYDYVKDLKDFIIPPNNVKQLKKATIKHLLTFTLGQESSLKNILLSKGWQKLNPEETNWLKAALTIEIKDKPGTTFCYSNVGNFLLSYITSKITGKKLSEFVNEVIFEKLDIRDFIWGENNGITLGASELKLKIMDMFKIAILILNDGKYNDKQLIDNKLVKQMKTTQISKEMVNYSYLSPYFARLTYGFNIWLDEKGNFHNEGGGGQCLYSNVAKNRVMVIFSDENNNHRQIRQIAGKLLNE